MKNIDRVTNLLKQIEILLRTCHETNWLRAMEHFISQLSSHSKIDDQLHIIRELMGIFGGMGSFNDLVLFGGGTVLFDENEQLDELRKELYEICKTVI